MILHLANKHYVVCNRCLIKIESSRFHHIIFFDLTWNVANHITVSAAYVHEVTYGWWRSSRFWYPAMNNLPVYCNGRVLLLIGRQTPVLTNGYITHRQTQHVEMLAKHWQSFHAFFFFLWISSVWIGINVMLWDPFIGLIEWFGGFLGLCLFMGPLPSRLEGKDAILAYVSRKFRETPLLSCYGCQQGVDIKEKQVERRAGYFLRFIFKKAFEKEISDSNKAVFVPLCVFYNII